MCFDWWEKSYRKYKILFDIFMILGDNIIVNCIWILFSIYLFVIMERMMKMMLLNDDVFYIKGMM